MSQYNSPSISKAFGQALSSCFHPKIWVAFLIPILSFIVTSILFASFLWSTIDGWIDYALSLVGWINSMDAWMLDTLSFGIMGSISWLATFLTVGLLGAMTAVVITAVVVDDMLINHIYKKHFGHLQARGISLKQDIKNTLYYAAILVITIIVGLPLWFFPPIAIIWQVYWARFFFSRTLPFDALCNYASNDELTSILQQEKSANGKIGLWCALFNYVPFAAVFVPIFAILWFGHYNFAVLEQKRANTI